MVVTTNEKPDIKVKIEFEFPFKEDFVAPWNSIQMMIQQKLNEIRGLVCEETHVRGIKMKLTVNTSDREPIDEIVRYYDDLDNVHRFFGISRLVGKTSMFLV